MDIYFDFLILLISVYIWEEKCICERHVTFEMRIHFTVNPGNIYKGLV